MTNIDRVGITQGYPLPERTPSLQKEQQQDLPSDSVALNSSRNDSEKPPVDKKKWTVMLYSAADNNLETDMVQDVIDLESVGSDKNTNVLVQLDRGESASSISGGWKGCKRFYLNQGGDSSNLTSPPLQDLGQVNMADPKALADFIKWGVQNYPAEHYILIISDHGGGWTGAISDDSSGSWMKTKQIREALETAEKATGQKLDILGFDACVMASTEVGYELKDTANFMVASQNNEGADGWPYPQIFTSRVMKSFQRALREKLDIEPEEVAKKIVKEAEGFQSALPTLSAVDMAKMDGLAKATDGFAEKLIATDTPKATLMSIIKSTKSFSGYKDQFDFAERLVKSADVKDEELKKAAREMMDAVKNTVIAEEHSDSMKGAHGLHIELPSYASTTSQEYKELKLSQHTRWDEALGKLAQ